MKKSFLIAPVLAVVFGSSALAQTAALPSTSPASTPTQKIAVIDMQSALISTKDGQKAVADLRAKYSPKDQDLQKRQQELQTKQDQYRKTQNTISEDAKAKLERDIDTLNRGLQRDTDDAKQDMDQDQQRLLQDLGGRMMQVLTKYATDNKLTIVFDVSGQPNNLLFASSAVDITRDIIALYDKAAPVTPTAPPAAATPQPKPPAVTSAPRRTAPAPANTSKP